MINNDRVVPVTRTDLLSLYATMLEIAGNNVIYIDAKAPGEFYIANDGYAANAVLMLREPVKKLEIEGAIGDGVNVAFVPAMDFEGVYLEGYLQEDDFFSAVIDAATLCMGGVEVDTESNNTSFVWQTVTPVISGGSNTDSNTGGGVEPK